MIEIFLDASQLELIEPCPRKWFYAHVLNLEPKRARKAFDIGSYYHEVLAQYYTSFKTITDPIERMKTNFNFAAQTELFNKYNIKKLDDQKFHRGRLADYLNYWIDEDELMEVISVENGFTYLLYEDEYRRYFLEGKIDLVNKLKGYGLNVMDHKTQARKDDRWPFNHQVCNYLSFMESCGTPADYFVYNYIGIQDKLPIGGMRRVVYRPHPGMLVQWKKEVKRTFDFLYNKRIAYKFKTGELIEIDTTKIRDYENYYERKRSACDSSKFGLCQFHHICSVPDDSKFRPAVFSMYKEQDKKWRPWT